MKVFIHDEGRTQYESSDHQKVMCYSVYVQNKTLFHDRKQYLKQMVTVALEEKEISTLSLIKVLAGIPLLLVQKFLS